MQRIEEQKFMPKFVVMECQVVYHKHNKLYLFDNALLTYSFLKLLTLYRRCTSHYSTTC